MEKLNKGLDELVDYIKNTDDYKKCIKLKNQMEENEEVKSLIKEIKSLQKKYIRSNYDDNIKTTLDEKNELLFKIPIYVTYNQHLENVNNMISYVKDSLNDYFYELLKYNMITINIFFFKSLFFFNIEVLRLILLFGNMLKLVFKLL